MMTGSNFSFFLLNLNLIFKIDAMVTIFSLNVYTFFDSPSIKIGSSETSLALALCCREIIIKLELN